jgi:hypothetical protein
MSWLPVWSLRVRLEKLLGLWRLRLGLLQVLGLAVLPLVLDQKALSRHRLTRVTGSGLARPGPPVLFAAPGVLAIHL